MAEKRIIDAEVTPVEPSALRCEVRSGIREDGEVYFQIIGPDQTFITIEGLLQYARKELDRLWTRAVERNHQ